MFTKSLQWSAVLAAAVFAVAPARAQIFNESGDAGQTPGTAQNSGLTQSSTAGQTVMIFGSISGLNDADVFTLTLSLPTQVRISTDNALTFGSGGAGGLDTMLFLFDSVGHPIYANDEANGTTVQSTLPAGTSFTMTLSPGTYMIGISLSGNEPRNTSNQLVFASSADPAEVRGPASGLSPTTYSTFNNGGSFPQSGSYEIDITTTAVPEPSTVALLVGGGLLGAAALRRKFSSIKPKS